MDNLDYSAIVNIIEENCPIRVNDAKWLELNPLVWKKSKEELPIVSYDVIGINHRDGQMEFGFRSAVDIHHESWADFSFPVTHWAYANIPEEN